MDRAFLESLAAAGDRPVAAAVVAATRGSAPRPAGAAILVGSEGPVFGSVGGGQVEARTVREAARLLCSGGACRLRVDLLGADAAGDAPICGGDVELLVFRVDDRRPYALALAEVREGRPAVALYRCGQGAGDPLLAIFGSGGNALWSSPEYSGLGPSGEKLASALEGPEASRAFLAEDGLFLVPLPPPERLLVLGGGHVGRALAGLAASLGFAVTVADPRPEFSDPGSLPPGVAAINDAFSEAVARFNPTPADYAVVVSPGHQGDVEATRAVLSYRPRYLGLIGSRRKTRMILELLVSEGFDAARVEAICAPIGLDIGAETPEEIAVSIAAELIAYRRESPCLPRLREERLARRNRP